jgi:hypothetical protein
MMAADTENKRSIVMKRAIVIFGLVALWAASSNAKPTSKIKVFFVSDESVAASHEVVQLVRQKMIDSHLFEIVGSESPDIVLVMDCMSRQSPAELYTCMYVAQYAGVSIKTFLGGGVWAGKSADDVAVSFLSSVASDISERWNATIRVDSIESLEACLFLTESNCSVPDGLVSELKAKSLNLSQYLRKGGLKK